VAAAEIRSDEAGRPSLVLHGRLRELASGVVYGRSRPLSHTDNLATPTSC